MRFFIYADNLNPKQLQSRAPEHRFLFNAYLPDHTINFPRWSSQWRGGLASIVPSPGERVWGIVVEITPEDLKILDEFDGEVPQGAYRHLEAHVVKEGEETKELVTTHVAIPAGKFKPKPHYLDWVLKGVQHWKLPQECVDMWEIFRTR